ncbi:MAG: penicillin-binding protein 2 [Patescibacteria group bacterium]|nr:penicillin-binding protein 2 [Patescibacteria group bacterium]
MRDPFEIYTTSRPGGGKKPLDWDESAADTQGRVDDVFNGERKTPELRWLGLALFLSFMALSVKLFNLQIINGSGYRLLSENNRIRSQTILAPRGLIKDRYGETLAQNTASFNLVAVPFDLPKEGLDGMVKNLAGTFGLDAKEISGDLERANKNSIEPIVIKQDMPQEQSILFESRAAEFPGFSMQKIPVREYLDPQVFSHTLGYTGLVSPGDLKELDANAYASVDFIGKSGIESSYEKYLHGINGQNLVEVDAAGRLQKVLGEDSPLPGDTLVLNIDKGLQEQLYNSLEKGMPGRKAAAIALDPRNGQVLALLSLPGFDNNLFAHGIKNADYQKLLTDKNLPLFNRAFSGTYPPGSTSKMMTATAGLQEGVITPNTVINDNGVLVVPNQYGGASYQFHGWKPGGLGPMTVRSAIAQSSDIFFYEVAGGSPNGSMQGLGPDKLAEYFRKFGLGQLTGIDVQGEKPGLVPDPAWKMDYFDNDPLQGKWYLGDTYHLGIGQGDLLVTPLQVAEWTAIIANNGVGFKPQVAEKALDQQGNVVWQNQPQVLVSNIASQDNIKIVQEGMRQTVTSGTARQLDALPVTSAGKTGTSQFDGSDPNKTHAWFTVYAPYEDPQIVVTVLVEAGGEGNAVALPVAKDALKWWAENRYNKN